MRYADLAVVEVDPTSLIPHPRRVEAGERFDTLEQMENLPPNLEALRASLLENGIRDPLLAQSGTNYIISGHFRRAVAVEAGWSEVRAIFLDVNDEDAYGMMLAENWERNSAIMDDPMAIAKNMLYYARRLNVELGESFQQDTNVSSFSGEVISKIKEKFEKSRAVIYKYFQLLSLIDTLQEWVSAGKMSMEAALSLCSKSEDVQETFAIDFMDSKKVTVADVKSYLSVLSGKNSMERLKSAGQAEPVIQEVGFLPINEDYYWTEAAALRYDTINVYI